MTKPKHVPECFNGRQRSGGLPCICNRLRACEQRMLDDDVLAAAHHGQKGYEIGFRKGLNAAREAVEQASSLLQPLGPALAAIDALRGER